MSSQPPINRSTEKGAALLLYALFLALLGALGAYGYLAAERSMDQSNQQMILVNRAQAMAYVGVEAMQNWYNQQLAACGSNNESGANCPVMNGSLASAQAQSNFSGTAVTLTAETISNTIGQPNGALIVESTGTTANGVSQTLQAYFKVVSNGSNAGNSENQNVAINLNGTSNFSNDVNLEGGTGSTLADNGGITTTNSFNGFENIVTTQSITLSNSATQANIYSDGNVTLNNSGTYQTVEALGNVSISGGVTVGTVYANGSFTAQNGPSISGSVTAVDQSSANQGDSITISGGGKVGGTLTTDGSVTTSGGTTLNQVEIEGNLTVNNDGSVASGQVGGAITANNGSIIKATEDPGLQVPITPLTPFTISTPTVNATALEGDANVDILPPPSSAPGDIVGTAVVQDENGIPNGSYYLYAAKGPNYNDDVWLTTSETSPSEQYKIIQGYSSSSPLTYSNGSWTYRDFASAPSMIPGIIWFDGNLTLTNTGLYDGIIATGTITTSNEETNYAPNFAYGEPNDPECVDTGFSVNGETVYPTNFCTSPYTPASIGNIALLAGDDMDFSNSTTVYGDVIAGNLIHATNAVTIDGYIAAADNSGTGSNTFTNSLTVDLNNLPKSFTAPIPNQYSNISPANSGGNFFLQLSGIRWVQ